MCVLGTQLDYVTGMGPVGDTGYPLLPKGTSGALGCGALAFYLLCQPGGVLLLIESLGPPDQQKGGFQQPPATSV